MMNKLKKPLSLVLCVLMCISLFPGWAFAEDTIQTDAALPAGTTAPDSSVDETVEPEAIELYEDAENVRPLDSEGEIDSEIVAEEPVTPPETATAPVEGENAEEVSVDPIPEVESPESVDTIAAESATEEEAPAITVETVAETNEENQTAELFESVPGTDTEAERIAIGETKTITIENAGNAKYFVFTTEVDGYYTVSVANASSKVMVHTYDNIGNSNYEGEDGFTKEFSANEECYFSIQFEEAVSGSFDVSVTKEAFDNNLRAYPTGDEGAWYKEITARIGTTVTMDVSVEAKDTSAITYTWYNHISSEQLDETSNVLTVPLSSRYEAYDCVVQDQYNESVTVEFWVYGRAIVSEADLPELNIQELDLDEIGTGTIVNQGDFVYYSFSCNESGKYEFIASPFSSSYTGLLARMELYYRIPNDSEGRFTTLDSIDGYMTDSNRVQVFELDAGTIYYPVLHHDTDYSADSDEKTGDVTLQIKKAAVMSESAVSVHVDESVTAELAAPGAVAYYSFVPTETGPYVFETDLAEGAAPEVNIKIYDESEKWVSDFGKAVLEAGKVYYFAVYLVSGNSITVPLTLLSSNQLEAYPTCSINQLVRASETTELSVNYTAIDTNEISFAWTMEGSEQTIGSESSLFVTASSQEGVADTYVCTVSDAYGNMEAVRFTVTTISYEVIGDGSVFTVETQIDDPYAGGWKATVFYFKPNETGCYEFRADFGPGVVVDQGDVTALWPSKLLDGEWQGKSIYNGEGNALVDTEIVRDVLQADTGYCFEIISYTGAPVTFSVRIFPENACGEQATWAFSDGTLTVSGAGSTWYYAGIDYAWDNYTSEITKVVVEEGITELAFATDGYHHAAVTEINLPVSLEKLSRIDGIQQPSLVLRYAGTTAQWAAVDTSESNMALLTVLCSDGEVKNNTCGDGVTWEFDTDAGILTISGNGKIDDYSLVYGDVPWKRLSSRITRVVLEEGITGVGLYALAGLYMLTRLDLPVSLTEIPEWMLYQSPVDDIYYAGTSAQWRAISIPAYNESLIRANLHCAEADVDMSSWAGAQADWDFDETSGTLVISGTGSIWDYAIEETATPPWFGVKDQIQSIVIESGITGIGGDNFSEMPGLTNVVLPDSVIRIENSAFANAVSLRTVDLPVNLKTIEDFAFYGCSALEDVSLPAGTESIGQMAFAGCTSLLTAYIPSSVNFIGTGAFEGSGLRTVHYAGTADQWNAIDIEENNAVLLSAELVAEPGAGGTVIPIAVDETLNIELSEQGKEVICSFTPEMSGPYRFLPNIAFMFSGVDYSLYDETGAAVTEANMPYAYILQEGRSYYFRMRLQDAEPKSFNLTLRATNQLIASAYVSSDNEPNGIESRLVENDARDCSYWLKAGKTQELQVSATAIDTSGITFRWTEADSEIELGSQSTLTVNAGAEGESKVYLCTVKDGAYGNTETIRFTVNSIAFQELGMGDSFTVTTRRGDVGYSQMYWGDYYFRPTETGVFRFAADFGTLDVESGEVSALYPSALSNGNTVSKSLWNTGDDPESEVIEDLLQAGEEYCLRIMSSAPMTIGFAVNEGNLGELTLEPAGETERTVAYGETVQLGVTATPAKEGDQLSYSWTRTTNWTESGEAETVAVDTFTREIRTDAIKRPYQYVCTVSDVRGNTASVTFHVDYARPDGHVGNEISWSYSGSVLTLSGSGALWDYYPNSGFIPPWSGVVDRISSVEMEDGITEIGKNTFRDMVSLEHVNIPESVARIGNDAFLGCEGLPSGRVRYSGLQEQWDRIEIGSGNDALLAAAFYIGEGSCGEGLSWILKLDGELRVSGTGDMGDAAAEAGPWYTYRGLVRTATLEPGVTGIGSYTFANCVSMESIIIPETVTTIHEAAFQNCIALKEVMIPSQVTAIPESAFQSCASLMQIEVPDQVEEIGSYAFADCISAETVTLGRSLGRIGNEAFLGCRSVASFITDEENMKYYSEDGVLFERLGENGDVRLLAYPAGKTDTYYEIPGDIVEIADYAFCRCAHLQGIYIDSIATSISGNAFFECGALEYFATDENTPDTWAAFWSSNGILFGRDEEGQTVLVSYPGGRTESSYEVPDGVVKIGAYAFFNCTTLESISFPMTLTEICAGAFRGSGLTEAVLPENVTVIGDDAFNGCGLLESITIPESASIGAGAFKNCENLKTVYYAGTTAQWRAISLNSGLGEIRLFSSDGYDEELWVTVSEPEAVPGGVILKMESNGSIIYTLGLDRPGGKYLTYQEDELEESGVLLEKAGNFLISARAVNEETGQYSDVVSLNITLEQSEMPELVAENGRVAIRANSENTEDTRIYYTVDIGEEPGRQSYLYTAPLELERNIMLKALVIENGKAPSETAAKWFYASENQSGLVVGADTYGFGNRPVSIGVDIYQNAFQGSVLGRFFYDNYKSQAVCFGMTTTALLFKYNILQKNEYFEENSLSSVRDPNRDDANLMKQIEKYQISQFLLDRLPENDVPGWGPVDNGSRRLDDAYLDAIARACSGEEPIILRLWSRNGTSHAVAPCRIDGSRVYVYDSNFPEEEPYLTFTKQSDGRYQFSYSKGTYNSALSYVSLSTLLEKLDGVQNGRINVFAEETEQYLVAMNTAHYAILDAGGIETENYSMVETAADMTTENTVLRLNHGTYTILNRDPGLKEWTVSVAQEQEYYRVVITDPGARVEIGEENGHLYVTVRADNRAKVLVDAYNASGLENRLEFTAGYVKVHTNSDDTMQVETTVPSIVVNGREYVLNQKSSVRDIYLGTIAQETGSGELKAYVSKPRPKILTDIPALPEGSCTMTVLATDTGDNGAICAAGYNEAGKMIQYRQTETIAGKTRYPISVAEGVTEVKVFLLDKDTHVPLTEHLSICNREG